MNNSKAVLLFEFKYHQEIIPSQIGFLLDAGFDVHLFLDRDLWDDALFSCVKHKIRVTLVPNTAKWLNKFRLYFQIREYTRRNNITHLIVNTLDSTFGSFIIKSLSHLYKVGVAHRVHDIANNRTFENNVRQMDGVLTLSVKTHQYINTNFPWVSSPCWFYPIFFCNENVKPREHRFTEVSVVIPGQISYDRRDYESLLHAAARLKEKHIPVKFKLLGNARRFDGPQLRDKIEATGLEQYFTVWDGFVPYEVFLQEIADADFVMPLLSPDQSNSGNYQCSQISAAINWALGFRKKVLLHHHFADLDFLAANSVFYTTEGMDDVLAGLTKPQPADFVDVPELAFQNIRNNYLKVFNNR